MEAMPSAAPTRPRAGETLLDLGSVEALTDLPDDAREAFAAAATMHTIAREEEVSHFALALVVDGEIDVSATIVDAPALRLERNSILRSRGTIVPGVELRLVCASPKALLATWGDAAVEAAFRTCPWVEEDLRAVADRVQAKAGVTMGPLGERFDQSLREHLLGRLTVRNLAPGEILVAQGKPTPIAFVGIGEIVCTRDGTRGKTLRPGDIVFPAQTLVHAPAPATATAGPMGAVVLYGEHAVAQELLMSFPPLLEMLATL
jgi:CRP-like cAMP-binding protein